MKQEITVNLEGNWGVYTCSIPQGATPLGTVTRKGYDTGALVRLAGGQVVQVNAGIVRRLPPDALEQAADDPREEKSHKTYY